MHGNMVFSRDSILPTTKRMFMCVQRCGHVLSAIFIFIFLLFIIYLFNRHITLGIFISGSGAYNQPVKWWWASFFTQSFFL